MKIRSANSGDVARIVDIGVAALTNDAMDDYLYPGRHEHPKAYRQAFEKRIRNFVAAPNCFLMVAVTEASDDRWMGEAEIAGFCNWAREGRSKKSRQTSQSSESLQHKIDRKIRYSNLAYYISCIQNPAMRLLRWHSFGSYGEKYFDPADEDPEEYWTISEIAVDPGFQRRGIGQLLLQWGFEQARAENLCISLCATTSGEPLYRKNGFRHTGDWKWGQKEEMHSKLMRWDPQKT